MSEIEKASEEQGTFRLRERAADARVIAAREKASKWHAKMEKAAEDRIREIAREEIESAMAAHLEADIAEAMHGDIAAAGERGRHERPATGLDKSPPAVEAPAAGGYERSPAEKTVLKRLAKNGRSADNNFAGIPTGSDLRLCEMLMAEIDAQRCVRTDMTALARRLAEVLNGVWVSGDPERFDLAIAAALAEARKRKMIE